MSDHGQDADQRAILARRDLLLRRAWLTGIATLATGCDDCRPGVCLSAPVEKFCKDSSDAPLPPGGTWKRYDDWQGGLATEKGPLFGGDKPVDPARTGSRGEFSFDPKAAEINALSSVGLAAFEELAPTLVGMTVRVSVWIRANSVGPGVDGAARAASIQKFLAGKGVTATTQGEGTCSSGTFHMDVLITACA